jgi:beta-galactosidase/beta-glucuronidase
MHLQRCKVVAMTSTAPRDDAHPARPLPIATRQDGSYPRPQLLRAAWADLDGPWSFRRDDADEGLAAGWARGLPGDEHITVPFPPESAASGVADPGFHPVVWYARVVTAADLAAAGRSPRAPRVLLHLGAVDYRATVWVDGALAGEHEGGHTPFTLDVTAHVAGDGDHLVVVRAEDDPHDPAQPRGKQDWHEQPHAIWYHRTTGIWQTVWLEAVPTTSITSLRWSTPGATAVDVTVGLRGRVEPGARLRVALRLTERDEDLGTVEVVTVDGGTRQRLSLPLARQRNGQARDELYWTPERPRLVDATVTLLDPAGDVVDAVSSYLGVRTVGVGGGRFLLNARPYDVRSVLNQGYWPDSHLAAPSREALRREVELIQELGFNACRVHQKIEDPRFLHWADRLGLLVWGEAPATYEFSPTAVQRATREWMDAVERDVSHPCVVTWVPHNESWGVEHLPTDPAQQAFVRALADLTRALDPTRPVVSNDGWEQQDTDIVTVHDYEGDGAVVARTYADDAARARIVTGTAPSGHPQLVGGARDLGQPLMLTEFGGVSFQPGAARPDGWGYTAAADVEDWVGRLQALYDAVRAGTLLAGTCYTQLADTLQETNGLLTADRRPKAPVERIRAAVTGRG